MLRQSKIISFILSIFIINTVCNFTVCANDNNEPYTLEQLFEMNDEDFLKLEGAQEYYESISEDVNNTRIDGGISGSVYAWLEKEDINVKYTANVTENKVKKLLGNNIEYTIQSPISLDVDELMDIGEFCYQNIFSVDFPTFEKRSDSNTITDKEIIRFAKCCFCINQIIPVEYYRTLLPLSGDSGENIITGDVNFDRTVSILDVEYMSKINIGYYKSTDAQRRVADLNKDGNMDSLDTIILIEHLLGNYESAVLK